MIQRAPRVLPVPATYHILRKAGNSVRRLTDLFDGLKETNSADSSKISSRKPIEKPCRAVETRPRTRAAVVGGNRLGAYPCETGQSGPSKTVVRFGTPAAARFRYGLPVETSNAATGRVRAATTEASAREARVAP